MLVNDRLFTRNINYSVPGRDWWERLIMDENHLWCWKSNTFWTKPFLFGRAVLPKMKIILTHFNCRAAREFPSCSATFFFVQNQARCFNSNRFNGKRIALDQTKSEAHPLQNHTWDFQDMEWYDYTKHLAFLGNKKTLEVLWSREKKKKSDSIQPKQPYLSELEDNRMQ